MLDECLELDEGLAPREMDFLDNLDRNYRSKGLTDPQLKWLKDIHGRG